MTHELPRQIHQTWRDLEVPPRWRAFQASWTGHHPAWRYRLWTDADLRELVREHYPWFLPIYDGYPAPIQRADAARYFLMHRYGGVYADLDFECLRPLDALLRGHALVLGLEPDAHRAKRVVKAHGLEQVVGNALLASVPGHRFWEHVFLELVASHDRPGPLESTGPFLLTRALRSYTGPDAVTCVPAKLLYPGTSDEAAAGLLKDPAWRGRAAGEAYAIHHWSGSWIGEAQEAAPKTLPLRCVERGEAVLEGEWIPPERIRPGDAAPLVSCLMVTRSARLEHARRAIACFQAQTWPHRELVVLVDDEGTALARHLAALGDPQIRLERVAPEGLTLGALRNRAVSRAAGAYVMQWDDDDLAHPRRIELQLGALRAVGAEACLLSRWQIWWPQARRLATSKQRAWEGSLLCAREKLPRYDERLRRGEDTPVVLGLASSERVAFLDAPWLYTYVVHGANTTAAPALAEHWAQATEFFWGPTYLPRLRQLAEELPAEVRATVLAEGESGVGDAPQASAPLLALGSGRRTGPAPAEAPRVLVLTPVKDGRPFLESYLSGLARLDFPADRLSVALLESDSTDGTYAALSDRLGELRGRFARVELFRRDFGMRLPGHRADAAFQQQRRAVLARSRNYLLSRALRDEDWVLWLDFDVVDYPADVLRRLLAQGKRILVPHCVLAPGGRTFDLNTFVRTSETHRALAAASGGTLFQPERGVGRAYLEELREHDLVEVDSVGGTMLLVDAELHREGLLFPAAPYKRHLETEGLALLARDLGVRCWGMPNLEVIHANH